MTRDDDFIGQLEGYLDEFEGLTPLPDPIRDAVRAQLPMTKQLGRFSGPMRRSPFMSNNMIRLGLAAAVIVLAVLVGIRYLSEPNVGGPLPSASATEFPRPDGELAPGTYLMSDVNPPIRTVVPFTFTVPAGWVATPATLEISKRGDSPDGDLDFSSQIVTHVYTDACQSEGTLTEIGPTADDLVNAMLDQANSDASTPVDLEIDGYPARYITMSVPGDLDTSTCREADVLIQIWADPTENDFFAIPVDPPGISSGVYIVDVNGERVVLFAGHGPEASDADIAELDGILASITFNP